MSAVPVLTTVNVTSNITLIYGAQGSMAVQMQLINLSTTVTIYIGYDQTIQAGSGPVIPLQPGASIAFDGSVSVYGICPSGLSAQMAVVPGGGAYSPGISIASLFSATNTLTVPNGAPGELTIVNLIDISAYQSYDLSFALVNAAMATAGTAVACRVDVVFYDDLVSGIPVYREIWYPFCAIAVTGNNNVHPQGIVANGPMHGHYMSIQIYNPGSTNVSIPYFNLFGSPRNAQLSDWRQSLENSFNDGTHHLIGNNSGFGYDNVVCDSGGFGSLNASSNYIMPFNLYTGPIDWLFQIGGGLVVSAAVIINLGGNYLTNVSGSVSDTIGKLQNLPVAGGSGNLLIPRGACALLVEVGSTGGTAMFNAIAQQGP
jgi:hypothetical protein